MVPAPTGASTAIQYFVPDTTVVFGIAATFHAPLTGAVIVAWANNVPGLLPELEYRPTISWLAAPPAVAVYENASAEPAAFESLDDSMRVLPTTVVGAGALVVNVASAETARL